IRDPAGAPRNGTIPIADHCLVESVVVVGRAVGIGRGCAQAHIAGLGFSAEYDGRSPGLPIATKRRAAVRTDLVERDAVEAAIARIREGRVVERSSRSGIGRLDVWRKAAAEIAAREAAATIVYG